MTDLIAQIEDPRLRERLDQEWAAAGDLWEFPVDGLIVVGQFGEPIFL